LDYKKLQLQYEEVIELREEGAKTFDRGDGKFTLAASRTPIHYKDDEGLYQDIDLNIVNGKIDKNDRVEHR